MENASQVGENQGCLGAGNFIVYADFNCPFCYALNERLHVMDLGERVDFGSIQHAPSASSKHASLEVLIKLTREVAEVRRRAPSIEIAVPLFRPCSAPASAVLDLVSEKHPAKASHLRRCIFQCLWVEGLDISDPEILQFLLDGLGIDASAKGIEASGDLSAWQEQWESDSEFGHNLPIIISEQGEKVVGFPLEPELDGFLQTGSLISDQALHGLGEHRAMQRILVLDDDVAGLQMIVQQMSKTQVEITDSFSSLVAAALEHGMPDLVLVNTALIGDIEGTDWWRNSTDSDLDSALPVIFLSDDKSTETEVAAFEAGAADFIARPFHPRVLQARLNMHLQARESQQQLNNIARVDALASICNRREFDLRLMIEWSRGARTGQPLGLLMIDVDKFKQYNDHFGHLRGDECLIAVAQILNACIQRTSDLIARYGGEEFIALLPESDLEGAMTVAEDCLAAILDAEIAHVNSDVLPCVTISIGVSAMVPIHDKSSAMLIEQADIALYQAKQNGRNRICSFDEWS
ncbi:MAG: diguanylate cyclase [Gammaproteobacteria bacterium]|nr:diguanylate cyclase [Gammaproteobacteria bacterium]